MTNTSIVAIYGQLVALTLELDKAITEKLDGRGFLPDSLIAQLAEEHASRYGACFVLQESGWKFYTSEEAVSANRHEAAQRQWNRCIAKFHNIAKSKRGGARKTEPKVTPRKSKAVVALLRQFNDLSAAERAAFLLDVK
jgi:hypothetical protein